MPRFFSPVSLLAAASFVASAACASLDPSAAEGGATCRGPSCQASDAGRDQYTVDAPLGSDAGGGGGGGEPAALNPLCGSIPTCNPDSLDPVDCASAAPDAGAGGSGGFGGSGGAAGAGGAFGPGGSGGAAGAAGSANLSAEAGADDAGAGDSGSDATQLSVPPPATRAPEAGAEPVPPNTGMDAGPTGEGAWVPYKCTVQNQEGSPVAVCGEAGHGTNASPCVSSADCAPGFACVGEGNAALCRRFCCDAASCQSEDRTYCAERPLRDADGQPLSVPVCVPADDCSLSDPQSPENCPREGTACMVVTSDGTTACVVPGEGKVGEACPCAAGHVCSQATNKCLKLCNTSTTTSECGTGKCQDTAGLPDGYGVCVGTSTEDAG